MFSVMNNKDMQIFKNGEWMTKEQEDKYDKLIEMGWKDVAKAYWKACEKENYTDEYKQVIICGRIEGAGMDLDEDTL